MTTSNVRNGMQIKMQLNTVNRSFFFSQRFVMSGGERLFQCEDPAVWRGIYAKYWAVVDAKAAEKKKSSTKLLELEKWYNSAAYTRKNTFHKIVLI